MPNDTLKKPLMKETLFQDTCWTVVLQLYLFESSNKIHIRNNYCKDRKIDGGITAIEIGAACL